MIWVNFSVCWPELFHHLVRLIGMCLDPRSSQDLICMCVCVLCFREEIWLWILPVLLRWFSLALSMMMRSSSTFLRPRGSGGFGNSLGSPEVEIMRDYPCLLDDVDLFFYSMFGRPRWLSCSILTTWTSEILVLIQTLNSQPRGT